MSIVSLCSKFNGKLISVISLNIKECTNFSKMRQIELNVSLRHLGQLCEFSDGLSSLHQLQMAPSNACKVLMLEGGREEEDYFIFYQF